MTIKVEITSSPDVEVLAAIHGACFAKKWSAPEFSELLAIKGTWVFLAEGTAGFGCLRSLGEEAEILTLAVLETERRRGVADAILADMQEWAKSQGAATIFLEVGAANEAALRLYEKNGFTLLSRRKDYYRKPDGSNEDALVMRQNVTNV